MSAVAIVLIVIAALILIGVIAFAFSPARRAEQRLRTERDEAATRHRELASDHHSRASVADQRAEEARLQAERAQHEADLARREAQAHEGRADLHDEGLADDELESGSPRTAEPSAETNGRFRSSETPTPRR